MHARLRHRFPPSGRQYELFDTSAYALGLGLIGYFLFTPPETLAAAFTIQGVTETQLAGVLCALSAAGMLCAWHPGWTDRGYVLARVAVGLMFIAFGSALVAIGVDHLLDQVGHGFLDPSMTTEQTARACALYTWIYGQAARRLARDNGPMVVVG